MLYMWCCLSLSVRAAELQSASVAGMPSSVDLYTAPASEVTYQLVRQFVLDAEEQNAFSESVTFEAKEKRQHNNVADAVAALSNTDGGIVLVGVKDKDAVGESRIVGVPRTEHDALASSLHHVIPQAMPEIIPVAMPSGEKVVLVLRVDADAVAHPVMVGGKVLFRIPGHSVPADRQRVLDLVARDQADRENERGPLDVRSSQAGAGRRHVWLAEKVVPGVTMPYAGGLRITGGLILPRRILDRPWLSTRARQAALDSLNNSPLRANPAWSTRTWEITHRGATFMRFVADSAEFGTYRVESAARFDLVDRKLSMVFGFRWLRTGSVSPVLTPEHFYQAVLGSVITISSTCRHVARALDAAEPADTDSWQGSVNVTNGLSAFDFLGLSSFERDKTSRHAPGDFPPARTNGSDIEELDRLARDWLTYLALDMGLLQFESWLVGVKRPDFLQIPDLP